MENPQRGTSTDLEWIARKNAQKKTPIQVEPRLLYLRDEIYSVMLIVTFRPL
jgi:hypothetical protein